MLYLYNLLHKNRLKSGTDLNYQTLTYFNFRWIWSNILHMAPYEFNLNRLVLLLRMPC